MSLTLHHFKKDFAFLRWGWLAWMVLVLVQLAIDLEWMVPMQAGVQSPAWVGLVTMLIWCGAFVLMLSYPREDAMADDRSFVALRPLPRACYGGSRVLVFLLLIGAPLMLQEACYLAMSGLRGSDVLLGVWERFFIVFAMMGWLIPMPWIAAGLARYSVAGVVVLTGLLAQVASGKALHSAWGLHSDQFYTSNSLAQAAWLGAALMVLLAWWKKRRGWSLTQTLSAVAGLTLGCFALAWTSWLHPWSWQAREPAQITRLEVEHTDLSPYATFSFNNLDDKDGHSQFNIEAAILPLPHQPELLPYWRTVGDSLTQNQRKVNLQPDRYFSKRFFFLAAVSAEESPWLVNSLGSHVQALTLSIDAYPTGQSARGSWPMPADQTSPIDIEVKMEADWMQQTVLGECELKVGAKIITPVASLEVLEVHLHPNVNGEREQGSLAVTFKQGKRTIETAGDPFNFVLSPGLVLSAPSQQLVWQERAWTGDMETRAMHSGWVRWRSGVVFKKVIGTASGLTAADIPTLRILLRGQSYAGTSSHRLALKDLDLQTRITQGWRTYPSFQPRVTDQPREGLWREFQRIRQPAADADAAETARYLADVLTLSHSLSWRDRSKKDGTPAYPGNDQRIVDVVAAQLLRNPQVLPQELIGLVSNQNPILRDIMATMLLQANVAGVTKENDSVLLGDANLHTGFPSLMSQFEGNGEDWKRFRVAFLAAIDQRDASPILALNEDWRKRLLVDRTDEEWLRELRERFSLSYFWVLKDREPALTEARALVLDAFKKRMPPTLQINSDHMPLVECAIAAGSSDALDRYLRSLRLWGEEFSHHNELVQISILSRLLGRKSLELSLTWEEGLQFLRQVRNLRAKDFEYDANDLTWRAKPKS